MNYRYLRVFYLSFFLYGFLVSFCFAEGQKKKIFSFWGEFYNETTSSQRHGDNLVSFSHIRQGVKIHRIHKLTAEMYLMMRYGKDLNRDYWNNRFETGLGFRVKFFRKVFLALYIESIRAYYIKIPEDYPQPNYNKYDDFRSGLIFWYGWNKTKWSSRLVSFPMSNWGEIYGTVSYYQRQRHNVINYSNIRTGIRFIRFWKSTIDGYGKVVLIKDINKDYWNNKVEFGPGIWLRPVSNLSLKLFIEWIQGYYFNVKGLYTNPHSNSYKNRKFGIIFWIGW